jgi:predicted ATPase/DNA-binding SARP family transcriptional activator
VSDRGTTGLELRVLGPVEIEAPWGQLALPRRLERALAVRLALARGMPVLDDSLARDLWGESELSRPAERLRVLASRLRAALGGAAGALVRTGGGYSLRATPVDLVAAEVAVNRMRTASRAGEWRAVRGSASEALGRWRGRALADLREVPFAAVEGERLDALHLEVLVERLAADVELGRASEVINELEDLTRAHRWHERLYGLLALALYRAGRQADALDRLGRLRRALVEDLGVSPGPQITELEVKLLRQDPDLAGRGRSNELPELRLEPATTTFFGRDAELTALLDELDSPGLVTLTGSPGSGKTRLALEVARLAQERGRAVAWVDLAPLGEADAVGPAVAAAAGVDAGPDDPSVRLAAALGGALLVIDNAEHLVESVAALVASTLRAAVGLSVLVTSQRSLLISGEEVHRVGPLSAGAASGLFCERSGARRDAQVDAICAAVDYLPLGIELAAGLTRTLTVDQLARRIDDRLRLLVGGSRDAGGRHTSLRAALDWSYRLLEAPVAAVLRRLAVFAGGATLEAAEDVVAGDGIHVSDVAAALGDLADRSLVTVTDRASSPRFGLPESVRAFALDRLAAEDDEDATRARHLAWCARHVAANDVHGEDAAGALDVVYAEWPNLLAALDHAAGSPRAAEGLRLAIAMDNAWIARGLHDQARRYYALLVDSAGVTDAERAHALSNYGFATTLIGQSRLAAQLLDRAGQLAETAGEPELRMRVLYHRGIALIEGGRPAEALEPLRQGQQIAAALARERSVSAFRDVIATAQLYSGDAASSARVHHDTNAMDREAGRIDGLVRGLVNEAAAWLAVGELEAAERCAAEGSEYARRLGDAVAAANLRAVHGHVAAAQGDAARAVRHFEDAFADVDPDEIDALLCRLDLADALIRTGDMDAARHAVDAAVAKRDRDLVWLMAQPILARLALADGDLERAARIVRQADAEFDARGFRWAPAANRLAEARELLLRAETA